MIGRRRFLAAGLGGGMATMVGWSKVAVAATATTLVWRLNSNWGYPVAPKNQTRCTCRACHQHAANKLFVSREAAISARIHLCCVCQPFSVELLADDAASLFPTGGPSIDLRHGTNAADFAAALARAADPDTAAVPSPAPAVVLAPTGIVPAEAEAPVSGGLDPARVALPAAGSVGQLPQTGLDSRSLIGPAAVLIGLGAVAVGAARTGTDSDTTPSP